MQTSSQQLSRLALHLLGLSSVPGIVGFPGGSDGKSGLHPWITKITWRREWLPTPVFLPGEFHGQRSLTGYSPRDRKESDMTERLILSLFTFFITELGRKVERHILSKINVNCSLRSLKITWISLKSLEATHTLVHTITNWQLTLINDLLSRTLS